MKRWKSIVLVVTLLSANLIFVFSEISGSEVGNVDFEPWGECATMCSGVPGECYSFCFEWLNNICDFGECPPPAPCPECQ